MVSKSAKLNVVGLAVMAFPLIASSAASAAMSLSVSAPQSNAGTPALYAGSSSQTFQIFLHDSAPIHQVGGSTLYVQIDDGGPDIGGTAGTTGSPAAPKINNVNFTTGTIFDSHNTGETYNAAGDLAPDGLIAQDNVNATSSVSDIGFGGLLATVTVDTTGWTAGQAFTVSLFDTAVDPTFATQVFDASSSPYAFTGPGDGTVLPVTVDLISAVPEPTSLGLLAITSGSLLLRRRRLVRA